MVGKKALSNPQPLDVGSKRKSKVKKPKNTRRRRTNVYSTMQKLSVQFQGAWCCPWHIWHSLQDGKKKS